MTITFTGVDSATDLTRLSRIAAAHPAAEFAVLAGSATRAPGPIPNKPPHPRFPPAVMFEEIAVAAPRSAIHLCGRFTREVLSGLYGKYGPLAAMVQPFGRVQVNAKHYNMPKIHSMHHVIGKEIIVQVRGHFPDDTPPGVAMLFDESGGRGIERIHAWPPPLVSNRCGFAGGLDATNIRRAIDHLRRWPGPWWLDLESGVRTSDDWFDLDAVEEVLERAGI